VTVAQAVGLLFLTGLPFVLAYLIRLVHDPVSCSECRRRRAWDEYARAVRDRHPSALRRVGPPGEWLP